MSFSFWREWMGGLRARRLAGPVCVMAFFLVHCAIFMNYPDSAGRRYAWSHLPLDDSWIHLSYAKNLLRCGYFTYNPGEIETGATSPLWAVILAAFLGVLRQPALAGKAAGLLCATACVGASFVELRRVGGRVAAWTGALLLALDPMWVMSAGSGMEIALTGLLLVLLARELRLARPARAGMWMGLLVLARPDMGPPAAAAGLLLLWAWRRAAGAGVAENEGEGNTSLNPQSAIRNPQSRAGSEAAGEDARAPGKYALWRAAARCAGVAAAIALPWFLYCRLGTGHWLPCTFYVKGVGYAHLGWDKARLFLSILEHGYYPSPLMHDPALLALLALGLGFTLRAAWRGRVGALGWPLLALTHVGVWCMLSPYSPKNPHAGQYLSYFLTRYYIPDYPLAFGVIGLGAGAAGRAVAALGRRLETGLAPRADRALRWALAALIVLALAANNYFGGWTRIGPLWQMGDGYGRIWPEHASTNNAACRNIYEIHERAGQWIAANVPRQTVVATQDAGAVRYYTEHRLIDLWGLNSHAYLFAADKTAYLRRQKVRVAVMFSPSRLDSVLHLKTVRELATFTTFPNKISEGDVMVVREVE